MSNYNIITNSLFHVNITLLNSTWSSKICHFLNTKNFTITPNSIFSIDEKKSFILNIQNDNCGVISFLCASSEKDMKTTELVDQINSFLCDNEISYFSLFVLNMNSPEVNFNLIGPSIKTNSD